MSDITCTKHSAKVGVDGISTVGMWMQIYPQDDNVANPKRGNIIMIRRVFDYVSVIPARRAEILSFSNIIHFANRSMRYSRTVGRERSTIQYCIFSKLAGFLETCGRVRCVMGMWRISSKTHITHAITSVTPNEKRLDGISIIQKSRIA